jgi:hypothetical protein
VQGSKIDFPYFEIATHITRPFVRSGPSLWRCRPRAPVLRRDMGVVSALHCIAVFADVHRHLSGDEGTRHDAAAARRKDSRLRCASGVGSSTRSSAHRYSASYWRRGSESNRRRRLCRPLHDHSATPPRGGRAPERRAPKPKGRARSAALPRKIGAGKESRTPDLNLGKVALYQLSYSRIGQP